MKRVFRGPIYRNLPEKKSYVGRPYRTVKEKYELDKNEARIIASKLVGKGIRSEHGEHEAVGVITHTEITEESDWYIQFEMTPVRGSASWDAVGFIDTGIQYGLSLTHIPSSLTPVEVSVVQVPAREGCFITNGIIPLEDVLEANAYKSLYARDFFVKASAVGAVLEKRGQDLAKLTSDPNHVIIVASLPRYLPSDDTDVPILASAPPAAAAAAAAVATPPSSSTPIMASSGAPEGAVAAAAMHFPGLGAFEAPPSGYQQRAMQLAKKYGINPMGSGAPFSHPGGAPPPARADTGPATIDEEIDDTRRKSKSKRGREKKSKQKKKRKSKKKEESSSGDDEISDGGENDASSTSSSPPPPPPAVAAAAGTTYFTRGTDGRFAPVGAGGTPAASAPLPPAPPAKTPHPSDVPKVKKSSSTPRRRRQHRSSSRRGASPSSSSASSEEETYVRRSKSQDKRHRKELEEMRAEMGKEREQHYKLLAETMMTSLRSAPAPPASSSSSSVPSPHVAAGAREQHAEDAAKAWELNEKAGLTPKGSMEKIRKTLASGAIDRSHENAQRKLAKEKKNKKGRKKSDAMSESDDDEKKEGEEEAEMGDADDEKLKAAAEWQARHAARLKGYAPTTAGGGGGGGKKPPHPSVPVPESKLEASASRGYQPATVRTRFGFLIGPTPWPVSSDVVRAGMPREDFVKTEKKGKYSNYGDEVKARHLTPYVIGGTPEPADIDPKRRIYGSAVYSPFDQERARRENKSGDRTYLNPMFANAAGKFPDRCLFAPIVRDDTLDLFEPYKTPGAVHEPVRISASAWDQHWFS